MIVSVWSLVSYIRSKVGCGYVWGSSGEICSRSFRQDMARRVPSQAGAILGNSAKWDGLQVFDCASLIREAFEANGIKKASGATTIWRTWPFAEKGTIDTLPVNEPGIAVFRAESGSKDKMGHIGMTIGGSFIVDARGSAYGVLLGNLTSTKWTHWARFADVDYRAVRPDLLDVLPGVVQTQNGSLNVRARPSTSAQVVTKLPKGAAISVYKDGQTQADWLKVYYAGGVSYAMAKFIKVGALPLAEKPADPPAEKPAPAPAPVEKRMLRYTKGVAMMRGEDVKLLQTTLKAKGYNPGTIDGVFGSKTKAAVLAFQLDAFPSESKEWDGIVGPKTWAKLGL